MGRSLGAFAAIASLLLSLFAAGPALAQKPGGILRMAAFRQPAKPVVARGIDGSRQPADDGGVQ